MATRTNSMICKKHADGINRLNVLSEGVDRY